MRASLLLAAVFLPNPTSAYSYDNGDVMINVEPQVVADATEIEVDGVGMSRRLMKENDAQHERKLLDCPDFQSQYTVVIVATGSVAWEIVDGCNGRVISSSQDNNGLSFCVDNGVNWFFRALGSGVFSASVLHIGGSSAVGGVHSASADADVQAFGFASFSVQLAASFSSPTFATALATGSGFGSVFAVEFETRLGPRDCAGRGPRSSMSGGDPHFKTWGKHWYDYHGECDLVSVASHTFSDNGLDMAIHTRTKGRYDYSYIESGAVKVGDDVLEVTSHGQYYLNGVSNADMPNTMAGLYPVTYTQPSDKQHVFDIALSNKEHITIKCFKDLVSLEVSNATLAHFGGSMGLMGHFETGKMFARDGVTEMSDDPNAFGQEWQVRESEEQLFLTNRMPQSPQACVLPDVMAAERRQRRLGANTITHEAAGIACAKFTNESKAACIYDVIATGELEMAQAGVY